MSISTENRQRLIDAAIRVRKLAYAPYSEFQVGASLLSASGELFTGCNVENVSYGLTICAERVAIANAVSHGERAFQGMALCTSSAGTPCGACSQVLAEFVSGEFPVLILDPNGTVHRELTLNDLLPIRFVLPEESSDKDRAS